MEGKEQMVPACHGQALQTLPHRCQGGLPDSSRTSPGGLRRPHQRGP